MPSLRSRSNRNKFNEAMKAYYTLYDYNLLSTTDQVMLTDRIQYKFRLSPLKYRDDIRWKKKKQKEKMI